MWMTQVLGHIISLSAQLPFNHLLQWTGHWSWPWPLSLRGQVLYTKAEAKAKASVFEAKANARRLCPRGASRPRTCPRGHITEISSGDNDGRAAYRVGEATTAIPVGHRDVVWWTRANSSCIGQRSLPLEAVFVGYFASKTTSVVNSISAANNRN